MNEVAEFIANRFIELVEDKTMNKKFENYKKYPEVVYKDRVYRWFIDRTENMSDSELQKFVNLCMGGNLTFKCADEIDIDDPDISMIDHLLMDIASEKNDELINTYTDEIDWDNDYVEKYNKNKSMNRNKLEARITRLESLFLKNEGKQVGTIYHVCNLDSLKHIRKTNTIESSGKWYNALYHGSEWVSFTRDQYFIPTDGLYYLTSQNILFQIVVDGNKLSENYKIGPYNDWHFQDDDTPAYREMEEAVKGPIKNASKYIKEIRFDFYSECTSDETLELVSSLNPSLVYFNFIRKRSDKVKRIINEAGITNGMTRDEFLDAVEALGY